MGWLPVFTLNRWGDPATEARLAIINMHVKFLLLGVFSWEYLHTLDVEYAVIRKRISLRWPLIPYMIGRFTLFVTLCLITVGQTVAPSLLTCKAGILSSTALGDITLACSSANLMIWTWLVWNNSRLVHIVLLLVTLGYWAILASDLVNVGASRSNGTTCIIHVVRTSMATVLFTYTMFYDFLVFVLSIVKLSRQPSKSPLAEHLRSQGIVYFAVAAIVNIPPMVFGFLGSPVILALVCSSATTVGTIVSCRAVRSLLSLRTPNTSHALGESAEQGVTLTTEILISQPPNV